METMVVVGIIAILAAIGAGGYAGYKRQLVQLELDGTAKQIFAAAQNHLSMVEGQGYLLREDFGSEEGSGSGVWWFTVGENGDDPQDENSVLNLMLPPGSMEETARTGGSYVIRYQKSPARVLDVFYSGGEYRFTSGAAEYELLMSGYAGAEHENDRRSYHGNVIIGYCGVAEDADPDEGTRLETPSIRIYNGDTLYAEVTNPNFSNTDAALNLVVTGAQSGAEVVIPLVDSNGNITAGSGGNISFDTGGFKVILDDITSEAARFEALFCSGENRLIPGENISLQAVAFSCRENAKLAKSAVAGCNSLFASVLEGTARIASFRHLENLSQEISGIGPEAGVSSARQISDLVWTAEGDIFGSNSRIYPSSGEASAPGSLMPVNPGRALEYDGQNHSIENAFFNAEGDAGVFGVMPEGSRVYDLELLNVSVNSKSGNAGGLVGSASDTDFYGILIRNEKYSDDSALEILGNQSAGGIAGSINGGSVALSAAAVYVKATEGDAGGLIGRLESGLLKGCCSGGHTENGEYSYLYSGTARVNVQGNGSAGGLVGSAGGDFNISACYSTASCLAPVPGGLIGTAKNGSVTNCYAAGRVQSITGAGAGAFFGSFKGVSCSGKNYCLPGVSDNVRDESIANLDVITAENAAEKGFLTAETSRCPAVAYDASLLTAFEGKYPFLTISQLDPALQKTGISDRHFGDWQPPPAETAP